MKHKRLVTCALGATALMAQGASIGINLGAGRADADLAAGEIAGVVPQGNWNNAAGATGALAVLNGDDGAASGASVSWAADEQWSQAAIGADGDGKLLKGFISENNNDGSQISFTNIPYLAYDLYVYLSHDRANEDVILSETNSLFPSFTAIENDTPIDAAVTWVQQTTSATGTGNYVLFPGLTSANLEIVMTAIDTNNPAGTLERNAISGIQIVAIPEPSVGLLGLLGSVALAARRRR